MDRLLLMDIPMPGIDGIEAARQIVNASLHIAVLMVTMFTVTIRRLQRGEQVREAGGPEPVGKEKVEP